MGLDWEPDVTRDVNSLVVRLQRIRWAVSPPGRTLATAD